MSTLKKLICLCCLFAGVAVAQQSRSYLIHNRGMLHQTVYNTGELGRAYDNSALKLVPGEPSFEWPGNFASGASSNFVTIVDGQQYAGHNNSYGGGVHIAADRVGGLTRLYSFCGGLNDIGLLAGVYAFPQSQVRIENFPVLADGSLNPAYNPNEAEEKIVTKWATSVGLTVTRTSRAWSFPDYDDFIIYEYEFENTGDMNPPAAATPARLTDILINFSHGLAGGQFGYERVYNSWSNTAIIPNLNARFDRQRWLQYALHRTGNPEPKYFGEWATTGKNGGGLLSPQAPGYMILYYDTAHIVRRGDGTKVVITGADTIAWDAKGHVKQPYSVIIETQVMTTVKMVRDFLDISLGRKYSVNTNVNVFGPDWVGRPRFNWPQGVPQAIGRDYCFGPYNLNPGEKIHITVAEVCGYGAARQEETEAGVKDIGGSNGNQTLAESAIEPPASVIGAAVDSIYAFYTVPNYWVPKRQNELNKSSVNTTLYGSDYLSKYQLPDYVNSSVVTIREAADRAIQAYTNTPLVNHNSVQYWPEKSSEHGIYALPIPVPAPTITIENTSAGENRIVWGPQVESFTTPRLQGTLDHYELCRATQSIGPWTKLANIAKRDPVYFIDGKYQFLDKNTHIGDQFYYTVVSVDDKGNRSGRTNVKLHQSVIGSELTLKEVFVAPNPFIVKSGFSGISTGGDINAALRFYNLPRVCTIRIYSFSGQLIQTVEHNADQNSESYFQLTRNFQLVASGVYFFAVTTPEGARSHGKFIIIN
jgi:hypothetical protein